MKLSERINKLWEKLTFSIYQERIKTDRFPRFIWKLDGRYFLRLMGVNIHKKGHGVGVEPFYIPFLAWSSFGSQHALELYLWRENSTVLFFLNAWPYLWVDRNVGMKLIEVEEEE